MISVIIPTYKRADFIQQSIKTVFSQSYKDIEIIIVDDNGINSQDQIDTEQKVHNFIKDNSINNITYISLERNFGACYARILVLAKQQVII